MKVLGRILALIIAGIITVLSVQLVIRKIYRSLGRRYIELPGDGVSNPD